MRVKSTLLLGVCVSALALVPGVAMAQSTSENDKVDQLQRQLDQLQQQMRSLKGEINQAKKKSADQDSLQNAYGADQAPRSKWPLVKAMPATERVHVTLGGYFAAESVWRQRNETADIGSSFSGVPFPFSPLYGENEYRASARQSRLTLLAEGNIDPKQKLSGYFEADFLGVGATSNYNQSNSWAPRLRQFYVDYDNGYSGFHMLAGQAWSMMTQNTVGITPRKENIPLTIDASYVVGFEYTRNYQARFVQEFGPMWTAGVSLEAPAQIVFTGTGGPASGTSFNGFVVNFANAGGSFLGSSGIANTFTTDAYPDIIEKVAFDPGWAHFEVFGVQRFFTDNVFSCVTFSPVTGACAAASGGTASEKTKTGAGIGGSFLWPILPSFLDLSGMAMVGNGVGRYAAGQLSDVVVGPDGALSPIKEVSAMGGVVVHPWTGLDIYAYGGFEQEDSNFYNTALGPFSLGLGNPNFSNAGCNVTTAVSFSVGSAAAGNCASNNKLLSDITVGFWQNMYNGDIGRFTFGLQWELIGRKLFNGNAVFPPAFGPGPTVAPSTSENIIMTSIRWYPKYPTY